MNKVINKICKKHGMTECVEERNGYFRCKKCRNGHVIQRRKDVKIKLAEEHGGKCQICGYNKYVGNLQFHHKNPSQKDFGISFGGRTLSYDALKIETDKCILLCANCHGEVHAGIITI